VGMRMREAEWEWMRTSRSWADAQTVLLLFHVTRNKGGSLVRLVVNHFHLTQPLGLVRLLLKSKGLMGIGRVEEEFNLYGI
jgi:hypothetical protein